MTSLSSSEKQTEILLVEVGDQFPVMVEEQGGSVLGYLGEAAGSPVRLTGRLGGLRLRWRVPR